MLFKKTLAVKASVGKEFIFHTRHLVEEDLLRDVVLTKFLNKKVQLKQEVLKANEDFYPFHHTVQNPDVPCSLIKEIKKVKSINKVSQFSLYEEIYQKVGKASNIKVLSRNKPSYHTYEICQDPISQNFKSRHHRAEGE